MANEGCRLKNVESVNVMDFERLEGITGVISNKTRLAILSILMKYDEVCACELENALHMQQSTVTSHLIKLYSFGILKKREEWKFTYYSLNEKFRPFVSCILNLKSLFH